MMRVLVLLATLSLAVPVWAVDRYVDNTTSGCSTPSDTDYNPATESCGSGSELVYNTLAAALAAEAANDTIYLRAGTYAEHIDNTITSGTGPDWSNTTKLIGWPGETVTLRPTTAASFGCVVYLANDRHHVEFHNIVFDAELCTAGAGIRLGSSNNPTPRPDYIRFKQVTAQNSINSGFLVASDHLEIVESIIQNNGDSSLDHGIYWSAGSGARIQRNHLLNNSGTGTQFYNSGAPIPTGGIFEENFCKGNGGVCLAMGGSNETVRRNIMIANSSNSRIIQLTTGSQPVGGSLVSHNVLYRAGTASGQGFLKTRTGSITLANNIIIGFTTAVSDSTGGTTSIDNLTSGTATDLWTDPASDDFTLKAGSAAINGGTDIGGAFCGSAPDQGAFEAPVLTSASINGNTLDATVCNIAPPIQPLGTWTPGCTGTGCGTPVTSGTPSITGGGLVRITVSGITGGACASGQTWTIGASGNNKDSALIGNQFNQPLHTVSGFAVDSSACTGSGGGGPPAAQNAEYNFENNLNDDSGNANHAVGSANISYAASRDGNGVQFTNGVESYVDTGLLSGHNPSTTHLVVAFGIRISASELSKRRQIAGVALGDNQRFYIRRDSDNIWDFATQSVVSPVNTEFPVVAGDTHVCVKFNPTTDTATLYINGDAGTISGASVQSYTSYTFPSAFRFGLPSADFSVTQSPPDIIDQAYIYTTDVSCADIYAAWQPPIQNPVVVQAGHQWQGVYLAGGIAENRGAASEQRTIVKGGAAALVVQLECTGGDCGFISPRFHYNVNGGDFNNVIPATPTADGVSMWGADAHAQLNVGPADGPIGSTPGTHSDGIWILSASTIPTFNMGNNTSYTIGATFKVDMPMPDPNNPPRVCIKVFDQSGNPLSSYTPSEGACLTQKNATASGGP